MTYSRVLALVLCCFTASHSYSETTGDILNPSTISGSYEACSGSDCWAGYSGGHVPTWNGGTARWGYGGGILAWQYAVEQALREAGINIDGYNYSWYVKNGDANANQNDGNDYMRISVRMYDSSGNELYGKQYNLDGHYDWTYFNGTELFTSPLVGSTVNQVIIRAEGDDIGYWAGHYGPEFNVANSSLTLIYSVDPCYPDPLVDATCPGYAEAYANKLLEEQLAAQQAAALETPSVETTTATEPTAITTAPPVISGGTTVDGSDSGNTESVTIQETADKDDDKKAKLDLVRSLDAANNFDVSSVSGAPVADMGLGVAADAQQQSLGGPLDGSMDPTVSGLAGLPSAETTPGQNLQASSANEARKERRQKLKEVAEERAQEIADQASASSEMDDQSAQQLEQLALMNFVPGFNTYQTSLPGGVYPDVPFYQPTNVPESKRGLRNGLAQQLLHEEMIRMQYDR